MKLGFHISLYSAKSLPSATILGGWKLAIIPRDVFAPGTFCLSQRSGISWLGRCKQRHTVKSNPGPTSIEPHRNCGTWAGRSHHSPSPTDNKTETQQGLQPAQGPTPGNRRSTVKTHHETSHPVYFSQLPFCLESLSNF
jgi:hypothetical protein